MIRLPAPWLALLVLSAGAALPQDVSIAHQEITCIVANQLARVSTRLEPAEFVGRVRAYFRGGGTSHWYYVELSGTGGDRSALLPRAKASLRTVEYYLEVTGVAFASQRTAEYAPVVVEKASDCPRSNQPAAVVSSGSTAVYAASAGAPAAPAGFASKGLVVATSGSGTAPASSGIPRGVLVGGVAVAGAATVAGVAVLGNEDDGEAAPQCGEAPHDAVNIFDCRTSGGISVRAEGSYWLSMSVGFPVPNSEEAARAAQQTQSIMITLDGRRLSAHGPHVLEYHDGYWHLFTYCCSREIGRGTHTAVGEPSGVGPAVCTIRAN